MNNARSSSTTTIIIGACELEFFSDSVLLYFTLDRPGFQAAGYQNIASRVVGC